MDISNVLLFTLYEKEIPYQFGFECSFYFRFLAYSQSFYPFNRYIYIRPFNIYIYIHPFNIGLYYGDLFCRIEFNFQAEG